MLTLVLHNCKQHWRHPPVYPIVLWQDEFYDSHDYVDEGGNRGQPVIGRGVNNEVSDAADSSSLPSDVAQAEAKSAQEKAGAAHSEHQVLITILKRMVAADPSMPINLDEQPLLSNSSDITNTFLSNVNEAVEDVFKELGKAYFHTKLDKDEAKGFLACQASGNGLRWDKDNQGRFALGEVGGWLRVQAASAKKEEKKAAKACRTMTNREAVKQGLDDIDSIAFVDKEVLVTVTVTVNEPPRQQHKSPLQNPTKRVPQLYQAVRYVNVLKSRAAVQQDGERRGSWLGQPPSAAPR